MTEKNKKKKKKEIDQCKNYQNFLPIMQGYYCYSVKSHNLKPINFNIFKKSIDQIAKSSIKTDI